MSPRISVIVLTFNDFGNLKKNIRSIALQKYDDYEVIIQDDGSKNFDEKSIKKIIDLYGLEKKTRVFHNLKNVGTVKNCNIAIANATGDIITYLSQDDVFANEDVLTTIAEFFASRNAKICFGKRKGALSGKIVPDEADCEILKDFNRKKVWFRLLCQGFIYGSSTAIKKDFLLSLGGYDEKYKLLEDYPLLLNIIEIKEKIFCLDKVTVIYGENGVSSGGRKNNHPDLINDNIKFRESIEKKVYVRLKSRMCREFFRYDLRRWKSSAGVFEFQFKNIPMDIWALYTIIWSRILNISTIRFRFDKLWKMEKICTAKNKLRIKKCR